MNEGKYMLTVKDNGIGLPPGFDLGKTQTLGLKLVNFLGKHQVRADIDVRSENGTEFVFRFGE
jgi:two-component sensor histidine kinase